MPYHLIKRLHRGELKYAVQNKDTKKTYGYTDRISASKQMRLLYAIENPNFKPRK